MGGCKMLCRRGRTELWKEAVGAHAALLAGTERFAAAALVGGTVMVCLLSHNVLAGGYLC